MTKISPTTIDHQDPKSPTSLIMHIVWNLYMKVFGAKFWSAALKGLIMTVIRLVLSYLSNPYPTGEISIARMIHNAIGKG